MAYKITLPVLFTILSISTATYAGDCTGFYNRSNQDVIYTQLPDGPVNKGFLHGESYINKDISADYQYKVEITILRYGKINADPLPINHSLIYYGYDQSPVWEIKKGCNG
jgi:hypothetical protein